jgi:hypothetical protein
VAAAIAWRSFVEERVPQTHGNLPHRFKRTISFLSFLCAATGKVSRTIGVASTPLHEFDPTVVAIATGALKRPKERSQTLDELGSYRHIPSTTGTREEVDFIILPVRVAHFIEKIPRNGTTANGIIVFHSSSMQNGSGPPPNLSLGDSPSPAPLGMSGKHSFRLRLEMPRMTP